MLENAKAQDLFIKYIKNARILSPIKFNIANNMILNNPNN